MSVTKTHLVVDSTGGVRIVGNIAKVEKVSRYPDCGTGDPIYLHCPDAMLVLIKTDVEFYVMEIHHPKQTTKTFLGIHGCRHFSGVDGPIWYEPKNWSPLSKEKGGYDKERHQKEMITNWLGVSSWWPGGKEHLLQTILVVEEKLVSEGIIPKITMTEEYQDNLLNYLELI